MADTQRTRAELVTLFADNTTNDISEQDLRDLLISTHLLTDLDQVVTVAKAGGNYTSIQDAIDSIEDAASDKIYTVLVYPGEYNESITLGNYIDIVAINPENTKILQQVTDNGVECHCYLKITIESASSRGIYIQHENSIVTLDGNVSSSASVGSHSVDGILIINGNVSSSASGGAHCEGGNQTINGNVSSSVTSCAITDDGTLILKNGTISSTYNSVNGHAIDHSGGTLILQNCKILCTHADAKSIYASSAKNVYCMNVWANRDDHENITQMISGGFNYDANVQ